MPKEVSLAGIHIGDSKKDVIKSLGNDYSTRVVEDIIGYYGEPLEHMEYSKGAEVVVEKKPAECISFLSLVPKLKPI